MPDTSPKATAAASGASATERFLTDQNGTRTPMETTRVDILATEIITALHDVIRRHQVTYQEYDALKSWLISARQDGEWPLFLDVWVEHVVEEVAHSTREGSKGTIEGPYYVPAAPELPSVATLPMRADEPGTPLRFTGQVTDVSGEPLPAAVPEMWQADDEGRFAVTTIQPDPYQIPTDGSCGRLIAAAGWHAWRPAHIHLKVSAPVHEPLTTQLYFRGGAHIEDELASAVKAELVLEPKPTADGGTEVGYDFALAPSA
ncbi:dioxygenase [Streptomyces sp. NPDC058457]|uniref:dioxygenase family protein n=1 Tax=Streptomyces sp. NPDC058457 TaxID=3346507 RepID=UPI0036491E20